MTLRDVKVDQTVSVVKLHGEGATKRRIMDMGITKGTSIYVRKVAPLGDPVEVTVRGYELSLDDKTIALAFPFLNENGIEFELDAVNLLREQIDLFI